MKMLPVEINSEFKFLGTAIRQVDRLLTGEQIVGREFLSIDPIVSEPYYGSSEQNTNKGPIGFWGLYDTPNVSLKEFSLISDPKRSGFRIIGIFLHVKSFLEAIAKGYLDEELFSRKLEITPDIDIVFKGYEIATLEYEWISFLSNCGKNMHDYIDLTHLNSYGLIDSLSDAMKFKTIAEKDLSVHAPFGVWGICTLSSISR